MSKLNSDNLLIVECENNMEFKVDSKTLEPVTTSYYDPYPNSLRYPKAHPTISFREWQLRRVYE